MSDSKKNDQGRQTLTWFVFRARRVAEHSLLADREHIVSWAQGTMSLKIIPGGDSTMTIPLPDEEAFESLAGRCRPFMMQRDDLHFRKVVNALRPALAADPERLATLDKLTASWEKYNPKSGTTLGLASQVGPADEPLGEFIPDTTLADAWLYCDFGHGDTDAIDRVGEHNLDSRFHAAVVLVTNIALVAMATLNFIKHCCEAGLLDLGAELFTEPVLAREEYTVTLTTAMSGPIGTKREEFEEALRNCGD